MLTRIGIGNFKAFGKLQEIPIKPITLIYGANSAGKSSILHSLVFSHEANLNGKFDVHHTSIGGDSVDLGGFGQFIHRRNTDASLSWFAELDTAKMKGRLAELFAKVKKVRLSLEIGISKQEIERKIPYIDETTRELHISLSRELEEVGTPQVRIYSISGDGVDLFNFSKRADGSLKLDTINTDHPAFRDLITAFLSYSTSTETFSEDDYESVSEIVGDVISEIKIKRGTLLPIGVEKGKHENSASSFIPISKGNRQRDLQSAVKMFLPRIIDELVEGVASAFGDELNSLTYLGPLRSLPDRHFAFSKHSDPNWKAGGGYAWDVVRSDGAVRDRVNVWLTSQGRLQTPYQLHVNQLFTISELDQEYADQIEQIETKFVSELNDPTVGTENGEPQMDLFGEIYTVLTDIEKNKTVSSDLNELALIDLRTGTSVSHRDVGIGISQVLPVLVTAYASLQEIIAIEQPELHLHPALQADLGDVFIDSALVNGNRFLLESHSEHLLLRIMRRMRETAEGTLPRGMPEVKPSDVAVLFVQPKGKTSVIRQLELAEDGSLLDPWPGGFFEEGFRERFS
jgi:predicted ATPase